MLRGSILLVKGSGSDWSVMRVSPTAMATPAPVYSPTPGGGRPDEAPSILWRRVVAWKDQRNGRWGRAKTMEVERPDGNAQAREWPLGNIIRPALIAGAVLVSWKIPDPKRPSRVTPREQDGPADAARVGSPEKAAFITQKEGSVECKSFGLIQATAGLCGLLCSPRTQLAGKYQIWSHCCGL